MNVKWLMLTVAVLFAACGKPANQDDAKTKAELAPGQGELRADHSSVGLTNIRFDAGQSGQEEQEKEGQEKAAQEPVTPEEKLFAWQKEYAAAQSAFSEAARAAKTPEERQEAQKLAPKVAAYLEKFGALAEENPKTPIAKDALIWIIRNGRNMPAGRKALDQMVSDFPDDEAIGDLLPMLTTGLPNADTEALLQRFAENSPHDSVKAKATMALARFTRQVIDLNERMSSDEQIKEQLTSALGEKGLEFFARIGTDTDRVETLYQTILDKYPDQKFGTRTGKQLAEGALFEIQNLAIGMLVPDIEGSDFDEVAFKLSDYRGKIVVLDFWGDW